ncbi:MAG: DUF86 domain-containing protein [Coriobacteriia bacterium]|nr:DUF86 domain-containing protein [Coriobacteriia bacterium]
MSGPRDESLLLDDVVDACERLVELGGTFPVGAAVVDRGVAESVQWNLVVLGEASKRIHHATRDRFPEVPWTEMAATRDRVVHHYEGILWNVITIIVCDDIPALLPRLIEIRDLLRAESDATLPPS